MQHFSVQMMREIQERTQKKNSDFHKPDMRCAASNDEALSEGEHIPTLNIVTF